MYGSRRHSLMKHLCLCCYTSFMQPQRWTPPVHTHMLPGADFLEAQITIIYAFCSVCMGQLRTHQMHLH